jgi:AraC-like DNA-binding protein
MCRRTEVVKREVETGYGNKLQVTSCGLRAQHAAETCNLQPVTCNRYSSFAARTEFKCGKGVENHAVPSCPARRPLRKNIRFYKTATEAMADNLRPCLRCRPLVTGRDDSTERRICALCDFIRKDSSEPLNLKRLSQKARLRPFHLQRTFKAVVGLTPRQYLEACRLETLKQQFRSGNSLTEAFVAAAARDNRYKP